MPLSSLINSEQMAGDLRGWRSKRKKNPSKT